MSVHFSRPRLHAPVLTGAAQIEAAASRLTVFAGARHRALRAFALVPRDRIEIPISTVTSSGNFDASIFVRYKGDDTNPLHPLLVDSGNSTLVMPDYETLAALPNFATDYRVLADDVQEPWHAPAAIIQGPIETPTAQGGLYRIDNSVFFACKDLNMYGERTANFGIGCISAWPQTNGIAMQSPLSYDASFPLTELDFQPTLQALGSEPAVDDNSVLTIYSTQPPGYQMFGIMPGLDWMALSPLSLTIGGVKTRWPGSGQKPIAMIDCGGGPVFLSDPEGYVYRQTWPEQASLPSWVDQTSVSCQAVRDDLTIELGDSTASWSYTIRTASLPPASRDLTLVLCRVCSFMMGNYGMNIGGISALFNRTLIDFSAKRVGFMKKTEAVL